MSDQAPIRIQQIKELFASKGIKVEIEDTGWSQTMNFLDLNIKLKAVGNRFDGGFFTIV